MTVYLIGALVVFLAVLIATAAKLPKSLEYDHTYSEMVKMALFWPLTILYWAVTMITYYFREEG